MLKITIDNEEVLSNKNFTIEEEMLNTPSVVLDNVYPKSWENDKDYVSRFYHPNDYSKCLIKDETYTPAEPGLNVEGTNFQITADTTKLSELTSIKGNTTQNGTPTPTTPVPINVVSGRQEVLVQGTNLLRYPYVHTTETISGVVFTDNGDGSITVNGTSTATNYSLWYFYEGQWNYNNLTYELLPGTYTFKSIGTDKIAMGVNLYKSNGTNEYFAVQKADITKTITEKVRLNIRLVVNKDISVNNYIVYPQIEKGTVASNWVKPINKQYEINLGKNLSQLSSISTTNGGYINRSVSSMCEVEKGITYTLSFKNNSSYTNGCTVRVWHDNTYTDQLYKALVANSTMTYTFTATYSGTLHLSCKVANDTTDIFTEIQVEKGSSASSYAEYKTPIELCKIGNYQDRIYKNGNKWYLEKKIGKIVLNGSEEGWNVRQGSNPNLYVYYLLNNYVQNSVKENGVNKSNRFIEDNTSGLIQVDGGFRIAEYSLINRIFLCVNSNIANTINNFKTWLSTHNTIVYYVLATPTTTEITDSELISQLESIELLEGLNNISVVSPYLQGIINIHYNFVNEETTSNLLFCGVVKNSGNISLNPRYPHYQSLQILDFKTFLSEGETLDFVIANKTIEEAIDQIIGAIAPYGFIKGNIQIIGADTIIGAYSTKDKTAYDVFNYLADITQSRWTTRLIDENTVAIDFYDPTLLPQGTPINYNETWFRNNLIDDMSYSYGSNDYRNKQVMTSNEVYGSILQTQTIVANGYQKQFDTELKIGQITSITANGTQLTIATNEQKELGFNADIYYTPGNNYFESADLRSTGEILIVNYIAIVEGRQIITNETEINRVATATGRKGIVARYENRNDANTSNELQLIGQSYIRYKGTPEIKLTIVSRKNIWNIGDRVQFNAPINELATEYMVKKKTINRILANPSSEEHIVYTYEMTSSFNSEQAINYFDNQRAKTKGNIGESEYITRNVDIENVANIIFYGSNVEQATITGDNTLQATLSSPIIN